MLTIDGSQGEGGGQILRSSLALSLVTGTPFRIQRIRARRPKPGMRRQHLLAVQAAARVSNAAVAGDAIGSSELSFQPQAVRPGSYELQMGSAGSTTLVLQTLLPALLTTHGPSALALEGGTHNPLAPPYEFLERSFMPLLGRMGARVEMRLERPGFYPAGGGLMEVSIEPTRQLTGIELLQRGALRSRRVTAMVARLPESIAERELNTARAKLDWDPACFQKIVVADSRGPGNVLLIEIESEHVTEVIASFGMRGVRAETVAERAVGQALAYLDSAAPVGVHLADQLMLLLALAGQGRFRTVRPSDHTLTQAAVIRRFLDVDLTPQPAGEGVWEIAARAC